MSLVCQNLDVWFGGLHAVRTASIGVESGQIVGVVGPNGAGKTTLFNVLSGALKADRGDVLLDGADVGKLSLNERCDAGIVRTFQVERPFSALSVRENVMVAASCRHADVGKAFHFADQVLERTALYPVAHELAGVLPSAMQRRLEFARAIATEPSVLLLDEVMAGLTVQEVTFMSSLVRGYVEEEGGAVLIIEHVLSAVRDLCEQVFVMNEGAVIAEGLPEDVLTRPEVIEAYMGSNTA